MAEWYYSENYEQRGPVGEAELRNLWTMGTVTDDTLVWREGMTDWTPFSSALKEGGAASTPPTSPPVHSSPPLSSSSAAPAPSSTGGGAVPAGMPGASAGNTSLPTPFEATASLVFGILSLVCFGFLTAIPGVICGHMAMKQIRESNGTLGGAGLAKAGLIMSYIGIAVSIIGPVVYFAFLKDASAQ